MELSKRVTEIQESSTLKMAQLARDLKALNKDVISLTLGEADFNTPDFIGDAAIEAIRNHRVDHYVPVNGIKELRDVIADNYNDKFKSNYNSNNVFVGGGVKGVLYNLFQVLLNKDDEVILPVPYWVSFIEQIKLASGTPVLVSGSKSNQYKISVSDLDKVVNSNTKALLLNTPSNPSGAVYSDSELADIAKWAYDNNVYIISDEIYSELVYDNLTPNSLAKYYCLYPENIIVLNGVSKTFAMTGWRLGFALCDNKVIKALNKFSSHSNGSPAVVSQYAALSAYLSDGSEFRIMRDIFEKRLNKAYKLVSEIEGFKIDQKPQGAFYLFVDVSEAAFKCGYSSVDEFALTLLNESYVATVSGSGFGMENFIRLSYAIEEERFAEAISRIKDFIKLKSK